MERELFRESFRFHNTLTIQHLPKQWTGPDLALVLLKGESCPTPASATGATDDGTTDEPGPARAVSAERANAARRPEVYF
jgi:hypothetical protein